MGFAEQGGKQAICTSMDTSIISQNPLKKPNPIMCSGCLIEVFETYESKNEILPCEMLYHYLDHRCNIIYELHIDTYR